MDSLKNLLSRRIRQSGLACQVSTALLLEEFEKIVVKLMGEAVAKKIKPIYFKNNQIYVACLSSVVAQELNFKKPIIISELNAKIGSEQVKDIRFVI
jgi:hypothetical protein